MEEYRFVARTHSSILDLIFRVFRSDDDLLFLPVLVVETDGEYVETLFDDLDGEVALTGFEGDDLDCMCRQSSPFGPIRQQESCYSRYRMTTCL